MRGFEEQGENVFGGKEMEKFFRHFFVPFGDHLVRLLDSLPHALTELKIRHRKGRLNGVSH